MRRLLIHAVLLVVTFVTTTFAGAAWEGIIPTLDVSAIARGLPFSVTLLTFLLCHESGHWIMCQVHGVRASLPYFIPAPPNIFPLGTLGAFIRIRTRFPDRRALFDIGAGGPWAGFVVAVIALIAGLARSTVLPTAPDGSVLELGDSLLTGTLTRLVLDVDPTRVVLHPIAFAGWFGLFVTSLNLLPAGQLDGGHVLYAVLGRWGRIIALPITGVLGWLAFTQWEGWGVWGIVVAVMSVIGHPPTIDDGVPLDPRRRLAAVSSLVLFVVTFVPAPFRLLP